jgi:hypothetical protein
MASDTDPKPGPHDDPTKKAPPSAGEPGAAPFEEVPDAAATPADELSFDLPPAPGGSGSFTVGAPLAELAEIPNLSDVIPSAEPASGIPPVPVEAMTPLVEPPVVAEEDLVPIADVAPAADPSSSTSLAARLDPPSGVNITADSGTRLADLAEIIPTAEPASGTGAPAAGADDRAAVGGPEPVAPVHPASGWLDTPSEQAIAVPADALVPEAEPASGTGPGSEGSDIFAGGTAPAVAAADDGQDVSDVILATVSPPGGPAGAAAPAGPPAEATRPSEVALSFDAPPGGSTIADPAAAAELPVADDAEEAAAAAAEESFDSARLADAPELPDARPDDADLGAAPEVLPDASSILAELSGVEERPRHDSSAIHLEDPGMERTISDEPVPAVKSGSEADFTLPDQPLDSSNLFDVAALAELARGDAGQAGPSAEDITAERPPDGTGNSSIFLTAPKTAKETGVSGEVPVARPDVDAVEFSDHPDLTAADSGSFHRGTPPPLPEDVGLHIAATAEEGMIDWNAADDPDATLGVGEGGIPAHLVSGPASGILSRKPKDDPATDAALDAALAQNPPVPAKKSKPVIPPQDEGKPGKKSRPVIPPQEEGKPGKKSKPVIPPQADPSVVVDWMAASSGEQRPLAETKAQPTRPSARTRRPVRDDDTSDTDPTRLAAVVPAKKSGLDRVLGLVFGLVVGVGACAALYFAGVIPGADKSGTMTGNQPGSGAPGQPGGSGQPAANPNSWTQVRTNPEQTVQALVAAGATTPEAKANLGEARLFSAVRQNADGNAPLNDDDLKDARADLEAAAKTSDLTTRDGERTAVRATLNLGLSYELSGDRAKAREVYEQGKKRFSYDKDAVDAFDTALERLKATEASDRRTSLLTPADAEDLIFATHFLLTGDPQQPPGPEPKLAQPEPPEAGTAFWKAVNAAARSDYKEAIRQIDEAKKAHLARAKALAGQGLNPTSDPLEQIFPRCCDEMKAVWQFKMTDYPRLLAVADKLRDEQAKSAELATKLDKAEKGAKELAGKLDKAEENVKDLTGKLKKAEGDVTDLAGKLKKAEGDLKKAEDTATDLTTKLKKAEEAVTDLKADLAKTKEALVAAEKARADTQATLDAVAKELQAAKILPAKYDNKAIVTAVKDAAKLATTNPDVAAMAERARKAEAEAKAANDKAKAAQDDLTKATAKYEADTKKLKDDQAAELKKLKEDQAAAERKLQDKYAADVKKLKDDHAAELKKATDAAGITKLKEEHAAELKRLKDEQAVAEKKLKDDYAAELKKVKDQQALELKKQADEHAKQVKVLEQRVQDEKDLTAAMAKKFEADLGNAVSPSKALDLWLTILTGLRRPADADPAIATAKKVLDTAPPGTEDAAKAHTVYGMALLIKGDANGARAHFLQTKSSPAYRDAAGKAEWARALDVGLASVDDPLAPLRRKPTDGPERDPVQAAKYLNDGIVAYRGGRFVEAEKALTQAAWHDDTNPLAWYFLGAARWQLGNTQQARADFQQGAERERVRTVPTRSIDQAISPIQGPARDALTATRP